MDSVEWVKCFEGKLSDREGIGRNRGGDILSVGVVWCRVCHRGENILAGVTWGIRMGKGK